MNAVAAGCRVGIIEELPEYVEGPVFELEARHKRGNRTVVHCALLGWLRGGARFFGSDRSTRPNAAPELLEDFLCPIASASLVECLHTAEIPAALSVTDCSWQSV